MKKRLNIITCVFVIFMVSSCDFFSDERPSQDIEDKVAAVEGISLEIRNKINVQDTLMNALVLKVDTLARALSQVQEENANLKDQVEKLESPNSIWRYMPLASFALAILALILSLLRDGVSREKVDEIFSHNLDKSQRMADLRHDINQLKSEHGNNNASSIKSSLQMFDIRLRYVESTLSRLSSEPSESHSITNLSVTHRQEQSSQPTTPEYQKVGYAKNDTGIYFTTIYESSQEGCVFKISFMNPNEGRFNIISLDKIQSRNDWQQKVECSGISIKDASDFRVEDEGVCKKIDENTWQVTKPLKIRLLK